MLKEVLTKIDKRFTYYLLSSPIVQKQLNAASQQTKIRHTSPNAIKACETWIPEDISTQTKIGKLLDALNDKIALNKKISATLEAMAKTLYMHKFFRKSPNGKLGDIIIENSKSIIPVGAAKASGG